MMLVVVAAAVTLVSLVAMIDASDAVTSGTGGASGSGDGAARRRRPISDRLFNLLFCGSGGSGDVPRRTNSTPPQASGGGRGRTISYADVDIFCTRAYRNSVAAMIGEREANIREAVSQSVIVINQCFCLLNAS